MGKFKHEAQLLLKKRAFRPNQKFAYR